LNTKTSALASLAAAGLGVFFLGEKITVTLLIGIVCVVLGLSVAHFSGLTVLLITTYCLLFTLPYAANNFSNAAFDLFSMSACKLLPCASIVTTAGKSFTSITHIASGTPKSNL